MVWACGGEDYDDSYYSNFAPEPFVAKQYSPFFYQGSLSYYGFDQNDDANTRYNDMVLKEWDDYLGHQLNEKQLKTLLFSTTYGAVDSVYQHYTGKIKVLSPQLADFKSSKLNKKQADVLFGYLLLAKQCETFAVNHREPWEDKPAATVPAVQLGADLIKAFENTKDTFVKQRLWFQLLRYAYFQELSDAEKGKKINNYMVSLFDKYSEQFPKNILYYRGMGYVAGHYYKIKDYAKANYLYSLCYDFSSTMKIPSKWSFRPQNDSDWQQSLLLAKNDQEKITLWQLLGLSADGNRAIENIYKLDPKSEKLELLLVRLVNIAELPTQSYDGSVNKEAHTNLKKGTLLVTRIAQQNNTSKPYVWNLAAGYLNALSGNYIVAKSFYNKARPQLPKNNRLILAQYKLLDWNLYISQLKKIDAAVENKMTEPLNWLANLRDGKDTVGQLRYFRALNETTDRLALLYAKQGDVVKSEIFKTTPKFYASNVNIERMKTLLAKVKKTPYETAMLKYYPRQLEELYYQQGLMLVYQEKTDEAIALIEKSGKIGQVELLGNPFNIRMNDCHDCDFEVFAKKEKYSRLSFLKTVKKIKEEIAAGKNVYTNTYLLANAYYNITHYGNARYFYSSPIVGQGDSPTAIYREFRTPLLSSKLAEKYYLKARELATTKEQKARCTFMAAKCERNEVYNAAYNDPNSKKTYSWEYDFKIIPMGKYFAELKTGYRNTQYYKEILKECGYFRSYLAK